MKDSIWAEIGQFFAKNIVLITSLVMGTVAKIAIDSRVKKLSTRAVVIKVVLSLFAGAMAARWMDANGFADQVKQWVVPLITLLGESIIMWLMANSQTLIRSVVRIVLPDKYKKQ